MFTIVFFAPHYHCKQLFSGYMIGIRDREFHVSLLTNSALLVCYYFSKGSWASLKYRPMLLYEFLDSKHCC